MTEPKTVDRTIVDGQYVVSTIRLSGAESFADLYEQFGGGYETMVFACEPDGLITDWLELDCQRYHTEDEARTGHKDMVQNWTNRS
jgi:predicted ATPase